MITRAKTVDGGYAINGAKIWSTMAHVSDYLLLLATTDHDAEKSSRGKTLFLVDATRPAWSRRRSRSSACAASAPARCSSTTSTCPTTHVIGEVDRGWNHILHDAQQRADPRRRARAPASCAA